MNFSNKNTVIMGIALALVVFTLGYYAGAGKLSWSGANNRNPMHAEGDPAPASGHVLTEEELNPPVRHTELAPHPTSSGESGTPPPAPAAPANP